jgi:XTP/dITP diphosphohydrolase
MPHALLLATRNRGKIREFEQLLAEIEGLELLTPDEMQRVPEVVEDGETFEHNARKKALEIARACGMLVLSDDSGLEVDALLGQPGVRSARYAGDGASDAENNQKLLTELHGVPPAQRTARYRVVLALADPQGIVQIEEGACEGRIGLAPRGAQGFGYDPLFEPAGYTCTMAELSAEQKNQISHRALAAQKMSRFLQGYLPRGGTPALAAPPQRSEFVGATPHAKGSKPDL